MTFHSDLLEWHFIPIGLNDISFRLAWVTFHSDWHFHFDWLEWHFIPVDNKICIYLYVQNIKLFFEKYFRRSRDVVILFPHLCRRPGGRHRRLWRDSRRRNPLHRRLRRISIGILTFIIEIVAIKQSLNLLLGPFCHTNFATPSYAKKRNEVPEVVALKTARAKNTAL